MPNSGNIGQEELSSPQETVSELPPKEVERGLHLSLIHGMLGIVFTATTGGMFIIGYTLKLGASNTQIGILAALPLIANFMQFASSYLVERRGNRKQICLRSAGAGTAIWLFVIALPFLVPPGAKGYQLLLLFLLLEISYLLGTLSTNAWLSWMGDLVPESFRGRFFGRRNMVIQLVGLFFAMLEGTFLDRVQRVEGFTLLFAFGIIFGFLSLIPLQKQPEPPLLKTGSRFRFVPALKESLTSQTLQRLIIFSIAWNFAMTLAGPFYLVYLIKILRIKYFTIAALNTLSGIAGFIFFPIWGYFVDRYGSKPQLVFCALGIALLPFIMVFTTTRNWLILLPLIFIFSGALSSGFGLSSFTLLMRVTPRQNRSVYLAAFSTITGEFAALAPIIGGWIADSLKDFSFPGGWNSLKITFLLSGILGLTTLIFLKALHEPGEKKLRELFKGLGSNPYHILMLLYFLARYPQGIRKEKHLKKLGKLPSSIAMEEIVKVMNHSQPHLRKTAVRILSFSTSASALSALINALEHPLEDIRIESLLVSIRNWWRLDTYYHQKVRMALQKLLGDTEEFDQLLDGNENIYHLGEKFPSLIRQSLIRENMKEQAIILHSRMREAYQNKEYPAGSLYLENLYSMLVRSELETLNPIIQDKIFLYLQILYQTLEIQKELLSQEINPSPQELFLIFLTFNQLAKILSASRKTDI